MVRVLAAWDRKDCNSVSPRTIKCVFIMEEDILSESQVEQPVVKTTSKLALLQVLTPPVGKLGRVGPWGLDGVLQR